MFVKQKRNNKGSNELRVREPKWIARVALLERKHVNENGFRTSK